MKPASELTGELFHATNGCKFAHVLAQHLEIFEQDSTLVFQRRLKWFAAMQSVFDLAKDPRIRHGASPNQDSITPGLTKTIERLLNCRDITAARNRNPHSFFDPLNQIPIRQTPLTLLPRPPSHV